MSRSFYYALRPARLTDAYWVASHMRTWDRIECAMHNCEPKHLLLASIARGGCLALEDPDENPVAVGGVQEFAPGVGRIWMLGTGAIDCKPREFWEASKKFLPRCLAGYRAVENYVPCDNHATQRWLSRLGFTFGAAYVHVSGVTVMPFRMIVRHGPTNAGGPR